jgi:hypothetical protein
MNMPLVEGSRINTGADGRAEIEFEDGSVARITPNSSLNLTKLEATPDGTLKTTVEQLGGLIYYELRDDPETPYTVMFDGRKVVPTANTTFRVDLGANPVALAVIDGSVRVHGASNYIAEVPQGQTISFTPSGSARYTVASGIVPNGFDQWNDQRDQEAAQEAQKQTPARVQQGGGGAPMGSLIGYGWGDLDAYGGWYPLPGYGMVWQPGGIGPGFDPYGNGMWANIGGLGPSWISGYPWGWLPFHYGMWSYIGGFGWGWMPGAYGFGGLGFGYGGFGYGGYGGGYGYGGYYPYTNVYGGPAGYRAPVPPKTFQTASKTGQPAHTLVPGRMTQATSAMRNASFQTAARGGYTPQPINFNGTKISPLHSVLSGVNVPTRNAALYNNYPAHAFPAGIRTAMLQRTGALPRGFGRGFGAARGTGARGGYAGAARGSFSGGRAGSFDVARGGSFSAHPFGTVARGAFGQHTTFGARGSFGGVHSGFHGSSGAGFHSGGGGFHGGGGGGFHGGGGGGHGGGGGGGHGGGGGGH